MNEKELATLRIIRTYLDLADDPDDFDNGYRMLDELIKREEKDNERTKRI